jgi:uncharacterized protein (TIGR02001 family)
MNLTSKKFQSMILVTAISGTTLLSAMPAAQAETTASIAVSNMYLWRGLDLSNPAGGSPSGAAVSGDLYYTHESGVYTGIWMSSEGLSNSHETDLNLGYSHSFGDFGLDVGADEYLYTENGDPKKIDWDKTDAAEYYIGGSYGPVSLKVLQNTAKPDNRYFTLDGSYGMFGAHIGKTSNKDSQSEYTDYNVSVTPMENLTVLVSMASGKLIDNGGGEKDPLFVVSYKWPFTIK